MKNLSAILLAGLMVFGVACTFEAEDTLAEVNQPFMREVETAQENTRTWEIGNVQRENSLEELLFERLTSTKDLLSLVPSVSSTKATLLENEAFPFLWGLVMSKDEDQLESDIVCSGTGMAFIRCCNGYLEEGGKLIIWMEDDIYYATITE